jgi:hypothetical protein
MEKAASLPSSTESSAGCPSVLGVVDCFDSFMEQQQLRNTKRYGNTCKSLRCSFRRALRYFLPLTADSYSSLLTVFASWQPFADSDSKQYETSSVPTETNVARYCIPIGYMTARFWSNTVKPRHRSWKKATHNDGVSSLERLELV